MIILNLVVFDEAKVDDVIRFVLNNRWTLNVFVGNENGCYYLDDTIVKNHSGTRLLQFVTKSLLFSEIESMLKKEFSATEFVIFAAPAVHIDTAYYQEIKNGTPGMTLKEKQMLDAKINGREIES